MKIYPMYLDNPCLVCGAKILIVRSYQRRQKICSLKCKGIDFSRRMKEAKKTEPWNKGMTIKKARTCKQCGIKYLAYENNVGYCSSSCYLKVSGERLSRQSIENRKYFSDEEKRIANLAQGRKSYLKHRETRLIYYRQLSIIRRGAFGSFTKQDWEQIKRKQNYACLNCGVHDSIKKLTIDHIVPISKWDLWKKNKKYIGYECNDIQNIQGLCGSCNSSKHNKLIIST